MVTRATTNVPDLLPLGVSQDIWATAQEQSAVMQLARQVSLPGGGVAIPVITGDPTAEFVGESERKPNDDSTVDKKILRPYKLAITESFSTEFRRDMASLYQALQPRLSGAIAKAFDAAVFFGTGAPTGDFDDLTGAPTASIASGVEYDGLLDALTSVVDAGGEVDGFAVSPAGHVRLLGALDGSGRPLFINNLQQDGNVGSLLGMPVARTRAVDAAGAPPTVGFAGEWSSAVWGSVEGIQFSTSDNPIFNGDGTLKHAGWQDNMFSILAEIEVGFVVRDTARFVRLTA